MFQSARLKLTAWYLLIIMLVSIIFSVAIYTISTREIQRVINRIELQQELRDQSLFSFGIIRPMREPSIEQLERSKERVRNDLIFINCLILIISGIAGYFLAGRTLRPIKEMMDEQNQFISNASHELRTPIATLRAEMEGELLEKKITDEKARKLIESNLEELNTLQLLSDNLLQLAQTNNYGNNYLHTKVSILEITKSAQKNMAALATKKSITIVNTVKNRVIYGDTNSLTEVFVILLDNAIKYSSKHTKIHLFSQQYRDVVKVGVQDEGIGISEQDIPHIFDRFYRADKSRSEAKGYGLGLSIAKKIIEDHNGVISVESRKGLGTTFFIELPVGNGKIVLS